MNNDIDFEELEYYDGLRESCMVYDTIKDIQK